MRLTWIFVAVVVVGLTIAWIVGAAGPAVAEIGETAPDFTVEMIDGGTFTLSEARGQPVVLNLWASWCPPCREEIPAISEWATDHPEVQVIGVAVEDVEEETRRFAAEIDASYPLMIGTYAVNEAYPHFGLPATYVINEKGVITQFTNGKVTGDVLDDLLAGS
jgi:thiol-disulfide isomerase/thioredoxin